MSSIILPPTTASIIVPAPRTAPLVPGGDRQFVPSASGLLVPARTGVQLLTPRQIVVPPKESWADLTSGRMLTHAREGYAQVAKADGRPVADIMLAPQLRVLDRIAADERHDKVVQAFMTGRREYAQPPAKR